MKFLVEAEKEVLDLHLKSFLFILFFSSRFM